MLKAAALQVTRLKISIILNVIYKTMILAWSLTTIYSVD